MRLRLLGVAVLAGSFVGCGGFAARLQAQSSPQASAQKVDGVYRLPPEKLRVAVEYTGKRTALGFAETGWGIALVLLLLVVGAAAWMRDVTERLSRWFVVQGFVFFFLFSAATAVMSLPLEMYGHHLAVEYGQSVQGWASWFGDRGKEFVLGWLVGGLIVLLLFWVMRKSPKRWWFWFWFPAMAAVIFGVFVTPVFIDPLFNTFEPLAKSNPALVEQLERVVARGGISIPPNRMYLMKASEKVTGLNAYVIGIGASKRVVVWDTSIAKATPDEIAFIFGHEMGHYVLDHIYKGIAFSGVVMLLAFWAGFHGVQWLLRRYGAAWHIQGQQDWAALAVIVMVMLTLAFLLEPVTNAFSRWEEHAADVYGQEAIHGIVADPRAVAAHSFQVLGEESLDDPTPHPWVEFWTFSHPSITDRKAFAAQYNPWTGEERK
jgi:Zn-dependent protease with chaperone function